MESRTDTPNADRPATLLGIQTVTIMHSQGHFETASDILGFIGGAAVRASSIIARSSSEDPAKQQAAQIEALRNAATMLSNVADGLALRTEPAANGVPA